MLARIETQHRAELGAQKLKIKAGAFLRQKRCELGLTQADMARGMGFADRTSISKLESGLYGLTLSEFIDIAAIFSMSPTQLMAELEKNLKK